MMLVYLNTNRMVLTMIEYHTYTNKDRTENVEFSVLFSDNY